MKKIVLLIAYGLILPFNSEAKKIEGKILYGNDTIEVTFIIPVKFLSQEVNYQILQNRVKYIDAAGNKTYLRPDKVKEIQFKYGYENIRMLSRKFSDNSSIISKSSMKFLKLEADGELKLFTYYQTHHSPGGFSPSGGMSGGYGYTVGNYYLQKGNGPLRNPQGMTFKKEMMTYFSDCPELAKKIEEKEFRYRDMRAIVRYYNSKCR